MHVDKKSVQTILLKGYYGFGNFGDDLLMLISYRLVRMYLPDASISIQSNFNINLSGFNLNPNYNQYVRTILAADVPIIDWTHKKNFDLLIQGGGGVFFDRNTDGVFFRILNAFASLLGIKIISQLDSLMRMVLQKPHRLTAKQSVAIGIGIGPYSKDAALLIRHLVNIGHMDLLGVRDRKSLAFLKKYGYPGTSMMFTDLAFLTQYWKTSNLPTKRDYFNNKIGIVLQDFPEHADEIFMIMKNLGSILPKVEITYFSFDKNYDINYAEEFADSHLVTWEPDKMNINEYLKLLGSMDILVSGRAHGVIVGALLGVIPIALGISQKLIEVSNYFPSGGKLVSYPFTTRTISDAILEIINKYAQFQRNLSVEVEQQKIAALTARDTVFS